MKLIIAESLLKKFDTGALLFESDIRKIIEEEPEAVVRCKHCKHFNGIDYCFEGERGYNSIDGECFCECGRRKDETD